MEIEMKYIGKADLTLRCFHSSPRQMIVTTGINVTIEPRGNHTNIFARLDASDLLVSEIDVSIGAEIHRFVVDSTTSLANQYEFHCLPAAI
jgi:hypothetical protein